MSAEKSGVVWSGPVRLATVSWVKPDGVCLDCEPDHLPDDDGGTYLTVRIPSQSFRIGLGNPVTLTIEALGTAKDES